MVTNVEKMLQDRVEQRARELAELKAAGRKVVGYLPGSYVPEEIICAAGAIPVGLGPAGDPVPVEASSALIPRVFCPFVRAQLGETVLARDIFYGLVDMIVTPVACQHLKKLAEIWEYRSDFPMIKLGVPLANTGEPGLQYYRDQLAKLIERLEALTGYEITEARLCSAIDTYNNLRRAFRRLAALRQRECPPVDCMTFLRLQHASLYLDPVELTQIVHRLCDEVESTAKAATQGPRLLLMGPNLCPGDYKIPVLVENAGGMIVAEFIDEGVRNFWKEIRADTDPLAALASGYLRDRVPCAFMVESARARLQFALGLIQDFSISGVIWYELVGCETYDSESFWFSEELRNRGIPVLILESEFGDSDWATLKTRVDAFIEILRGV